mmetsp:Transcript_14471/g.41076  ORF Transcript_14471/g.41076 Transcript_14471/m.41076 type:complete len:336 (-) Transcript_14471:338-1345(-)
MQRKPQSDDPTRSSIVDEGRVAQREGDVVLGVGAQRWHVDGDATAKGVGLARLFLPHIKNSHEQTCIRMVQGEHRRPLGNVGPHGRSKARYHVRCKRAIPDHQVDDYVRLGTCQTHASQNLHLQGTDAAVILWSPEGSAHGLWHLGATRRLGRRIQVGGEVVHLLGWLHHALVETFFVQVARAGEHMVRLDSELLRRIGLISTQRFLYLIRWVERRRRIGTHVARRIVQLEVVFVVVLVVVTLLWWSAAATVVVAVAPSASVGRRSRTHGRVIRVRISTLAALFATQHPHPHLLDAGGFAWRSAVGGMLAVAVIVGIATIVPSRRPPTVLSAAAR